MDERTTLPGCYPKTLATTSGENISTKMALAQAKALAAQGKWFEILGLTPSADAGIVKRVCRAARIASHPDRSTAPLELSEIINEAADKVSLLVVESFNLYATHFNTGFVNCNGVTRPLVAMWARDFEAQLDQARQRRDSSTVERVYTRYRQRTDQEVAEREHKLQQLIEADRRRDAQKRKARLALQAHSKRVRRLPTEAKGDPALAATR